ncbi:synaptosomal-associated protein 47 isoform X3 [Tamandua tetradactyla]|uniref:synaptosomal-associated protein 47 isoform X3 n=1 Tax=Tamandua tetradactyla TaxID=48850 RepID=UPI0040537E1C
MWLTASGLMDRVLHQESSSGSEEGRQAQVQMNAQLISEEDTQELRQILRTLKSLALDTETELERQDEALDGITSSVDRAALTVDKHNRRIKKLT